MVLFQRHNLDRLRLRIQQTSAGRIFTTLLDPEKSDFTQKAKAWSRSAGLAMIDPLQRSMTYSQSKDASPHTEEEAASLEPINQELRDLTQSYHSLAASAGSRSPARPEYEGRSGLSSDVGEHEIGSNEGAGT